MMRLTHADVMGLAHATSKLQNAEHGGIPLASCHGRQGTTRHERKRGRVLARKRRAPILWGVRRCLMPVTRARTQRRMRARMRSCTRWGALAGNLMRCVSICEVSPVVVAQVFLFLLFLFLFWTRLPLRCCLRIHPFRSQLAARL